MTEIARHSEQDYGQELTPEQRRYLKMQTYYFFPFLRKYYELLSGLTTDKDKFQAASLDHIKNLLSYYGNAFTFGEFNMAQEQQLITSLFQTIHQEIPQSDLKTRFSSIREGSGFLYQTKEDGDTSDHLFGSIPCAELFSQELPGGPDYNMGISGGIVELGSRFAKGTIEPLAGYIARERGSAPVAIWGNVARGTVEAAAIHKALERKGVPSSLHLFRASSHAFHDREAFSIAESGIQKSSWTIAVDTMSAGGHSTPQTFSFLRNLGSPRASLYLTHGAYNWETTNPAEFRSPRYGQGHFGNGILLKV